MPTNYPPLGNDPINPMNKRFTREIQMFLLRLWNASVPGGGGAPADAQYIVSAANASLTAERVGTDSASNVWDYATAGQAKVKRAALTGDATAAADSNALTLAASGVAAGTYGSATQVAQVTVNAKGLVTSAANVPVVVTDIPLHWGFKSNLTDTQFKALPTTYIQLVAAPGAGKCLVPWWGFCQVNAGTPYTNVDAGTQHGLSIAYGTWGPDAMDLFHAFTGASARHMFVPMHTVPDASVLAAGYGDQSNVGLPENEALNIVGWNPIGGDWTGGDPANSSRWGIAYSVLDFQLGTFT